MKCKFNNDDCMCNTCELCPCNKGIQKCNKCMGECEMDGCPFWMPEECEEEYHES